MKPVDAHAAAVALGRLGGARKTAKQQAAARENGKKGGRPRKQPAEPQTEREALAILLREIGRQP